VVAVRMMKQPLIALTDIIVVAAGEDATERYGSITEDEET